MGNCSPSRPSCVTGRSYDSFMEKQIEQHREEGQALLKAMVLGEDHIDWTAVISKANELHSQEQAWLRQRNNTRQERAMFLKNQKKALRQRKRYDAVGSFSVNMLTFRVDDEYINNRYKHFSGSSPYYTRSPSYTSEGSSPTWHSRDDQSNFSTNTEEYIQFPTSNDKVQSCGGSETNELDQSRHCSTDTNDGYSLPSKKSTDHVNVLNRIVSEDTMDPIDEHSEKS